MTDDLPDDERVSDKQTGVIAAVSRKARQDWLPFNWRVKPVIRIDVDSEILLKIGELASIQHFPLLSRFSWPQSRFPAEQMRDLLEECILFISQNDDTEVRELVSAVEEIAFKVESNKHAYTDILWLLVDRFAPRKKIKKQVKQSVATGSIIETVD